MLLSLVDQPEDRKSLSLPSVKDELLLNDARAGKGVTQKARHGAPNHYANGWFAANIRL
jgi:hypothetical protein